MNAKNKHNSDAVSKFESLWEEYKYRHDLIWQRTFTFTTAITLISIIPYIRPEIARLLQNWILIAPLLALLLAGFGLLVMLNELILFGKIKLEYREQQNKLLGKKLHELKNWSWFSLFVTVYFVALLLLSILNCYIVLQIWIPRLLVQPDCPCPG